MNYLKEVAVWTIIHYFAVLGLSSVFMWNHYKVIESFKEYANAESFISYEFQLGYGQWYADRIKNGTAFWFPDMTFMYVLVIAFPVILYLMKRKKNDISYLPWVFSVPAMIMACLMIMMMFIDIRLYLDALPKGLLCLCYRPRSRVYDCQCTAPYHEGNVRILPERPYKITATELKYAGVDNTSRPFSGNVTYKIIDRTSDTTLDDLQPWKSFELSLEFILVQMSIFVVILRLRSYRLYQVYSLKVKEWAPFHSIIESHYYLLAESLDALSLCTEFITHGHYFIRNYRLLDIVSFCTAAATCQLAYGNFPLHRLRSSSTSHVKRMMVLINLVSKLFVVMLVNVPLLGVRVYMVSLYGDEIKSNIIFMLFIVKEVTMVILGITECTADLIAFKKKE